MSVTSGSDTTVWYYHETQDEFAADDLEDDTPKAFGPDLTVDSAEGTNGIERILNPGSREACGILAQRFEGAWSVTFSLQNPWWLQELIAPAESDGTDPTEHTFEGEDATSMRIVIGDENAGSERELRGAVIADATITANVDQKVQVSLSGLYADEELDDDTTPTEQPAACDGVFNFEEAKLEIDGESYEVTQSAEVSVTTNAQMVPGLNSRTAVGYFLGPRNPEVQFTEVKPSDEDRLIDFYGSDTGPDTVDDQLSCDLICDNEDSGSDARSVTFSVGGTLPESYNVNPGNPEEQVEQVINRFGTEFSATAENAEESAL